jgi:hypothetical protein
MTANTIRGSRLAGKSTPVVGLFVAITMISSLFGRFRTNGRKHLGEHVQVRCCLSPEKMCWIDGRPLIDCCGLKAASAKELSAGAAKA